MLPFILLGLLGGCALPSRHGSPPRVDRLETLQYGISSRADVLLALGEPRGDGAARLSAALPPWKIWFYEYNELDGRRIGLKLLLVFFDDQERYNGHLWFSSAGIIEKTK
ncbi:MAG: hypothetical protein HYY20_06005 [Candidatus Tectomicrobia bacterium]|uniref:Uncharacterized protein n=1 Tax=Tectimicrobiota bacterium TaxID=2528274 RepID=A0A932CN29_UNCTE|nr:hypothetical protein [Candidatus Tectomicrobia bacterium]